MQLEKAQAQDEAAAASAALEGASGTLALPDDALIIVPVRNMVLFPGMILPITIGRDNSIAGAQQAVKTERPIGIVLQRNPEIDRPGTDDLFPVGTRANVLRYVTTPDGAHHIICQGQQRFRVVELLEGYPFLAARVALIEEPEASGKEIEARFMQLKERALEVLQLMPQASQELVGAVQNIASAAALADMVAGLMDIKAPEKQKLLEAVDLERRLDAVLDLLAQRIEVLRLSREIDERTKASMDERQREYLLREQLKSIQKELGEGEEGNAAEIAELRKAIADAQMPEEVEKQATKELKRLERMSDASGEYSMVRSYLDWLIELPWKAPETGAIDIAEARRILGEDHFGLEMVKKRILEFLAVRKLNPDGHGPILCFVGPPGVGKTSLGQSIARALGTQVRARVARRRARRGRDPRPPPHLYRRAAGQHHPGAAQGRHARLRDDARRDRQGSAPASTATRRRRCSKCSTRSRTTPSATTTSRVPYDLSRVLFITTANVLDTVPGPLRDRMEIVQLPGYTQEEKLEIARRYLVKRQLKDNGLAPEQLEITDAALAAIVARLHARGGCALARTPDRRRVPPRRGENRGRRTEQGAHRRERSCRHPRPGQVRERSRAARWRCPAWPPGSPGRRWAGTSCSSKRAGMRAAAS